ncbi:MAG: FtsX-like permease family protein [Peptococcaceae bacterium]|nr:FtsX-like permease family protein [Peptococcaceae bacterium]
MNPFWKDIVREIVQTKARFLSLILITTLGSLSVIGIQASAIAMRDVADKSYKEKSLFDMHLKSATGFDADDIAAIRETPRVEAVMAGYSFDVFAHVSGVLYPVRTHSLPEPGGLNTVTLLEGSWPEKADECVVESSLMRDGRFACGDQLILSLEDADLFDEVLGTDVYTIVGVISSPLYISGDRGSTSLGTGGLSYYLYLPPEAYILSVFTDVYAAMEGSREMDNISDAYNAMADSWKRILEDSGEGRVAALNAAREEAQAEIDRGRLDYTDGVREMEEKIADGREELAQAWTQLNKARVSLISSQNSLDIQIKRGLAEIEQKEEVLRDGQGALDAQLADIDSGQEEIDLAREALNNNLEMLKLLGLPGDSPVLDAQYDAVYGALALLDVSQAELDAGRAVLTVARQQLDDGGEALARARVNLEAESAGAQVRINKGWEDYYRGMRGYHAGLAQLNVEEADARAALAEAKTEIDDAQELLNNAPTPEWFFFTRQDAVSFESYHQDTLRLEKVGLVFPLVFFMVAVLVSLTSMSRMVEEQRGQIGVYKALGYRPGAIVLKYVLYAFVSGCLGGILGVVAGSLMLPQIIADAYSHLYDMPPISMTVPLGLAALAVLAAVAVVTAVTLATCAGALLEEPAAIMRPKAPKTGKRVLLERVPLLWNGLGFIGKVTVRNLFRYKRRFFMSVVGIAGCAALLLTAFGLRDSIGGVAVAQYGEVFVYDARIYLKEVVQPEQREVLKGLTPETRLYLREEAVDIKAGNGRSADAVGMSPSLMVPEDPAAVGGYIRMFDPAGGGDIVLPEDGVLVTEKLARVLNLAAGDTMSLTVDNETVMVTVAGLVENYVIHFVYMAPRYYSQLFGREPAPNSMLLLGDVDLEALMKDDNVYGVVCTADMLAHLSDSTDALGIVTIVLLVLACALAFVVLFNLTIININERQRELATIKVLGFQDTETALYMYRENLIVTLLGIVVGLVGGVYLNKFVLTSVEIDLLKFPQTIEPLSFVLAAVLSLGFALFVNVVMYRNLVAIDMVGSLKSVE